MLLVDAVTRNLRKSLELGKVKIGKYEHKFTKIRNIRDLLKEQNVIKYKYSSESTAVHFLHPVLNTHLKDIFMLCGQNFLTSKKDEDVLTEFSKELAPYFKIYHKSNY